jgi:hypothetical protein
MDSSRNANRVDEEALVVLFSPLSLGPDRALPGAERSSAPGGGGFSLDLSDGLLLHLFRGVVHGRRSDRAAPDDELTGEFFHGVGAHRCRLSLYEIGLDKASLNDACAVASRGKTPRSGAAA